MKIEYVIFGTSNTPYIATVEAAQSNYKYYKTKKWIGEYFNW